MMRFVVAAYALCAALLMTFGVLGSTPAEAGYYYGRHGYYGGLGYRGYRNGYYGGYSRPYGYGVGYVDSGYPSDYDVGYRYGGYRIEFYEGYVLPLGYGTGYVDTAYDDGYEVGPRYRGYRYHPGYVRGYGHGGCNGTYIRYGWSGYRASYC